MADVRFAMVGTGMPVTARSAEHSCGERVVRGGSYHKDLTLRLDLSCTSLVRHASGPHLPIAQFQWITSKVIEKQDHQEGLRWQLHTFQGSKFKVLPAEYLEEADLCMICSFGTVVRVFWLQ